MMLWSFGRTDRSHGAHMMEGQYDDSDVKCLYSAF
jgi:hypothetical protein